MQSHLGSGPPASRASLECGGILLTCALARRDDLVFLPHTICYTSAMVLHTFRFHRMPSPLFHLANAAHPPTCTLTVSSSVEPPPVLRPEFPSLLLHTGRISMIALSGRYYYCLFFSLVFALRARLYESLHTYT